MNAEPPSELQMPRQWVVLRFELGPGKAKAAWYPAWTARERKGSEADGARQLHDYTQHITRIHSPGATWRTGRAQKKKHRGGTRDGIRTRETL